MAGAGARTRKDGSASAKVGSIEVLKPRMIGPKIPMRRQVQAMATGAASAERAARTPEKRAAAVELRSKAESAARARAAFLAARKANKAAPTAAATKGPRASRLVEIKQDHFAPAVKLTPGAHAKLMGAGVGSARLMSEMSQALQFQGASGKNRVAFRVEEGNTTHHVTARLVGRGATPQIAVGVTKSVTRAPRAPVEAPVYTPRPARVARHTFDAMEERQGRAFESRQRLNRAIVKASNESLDIQSRVRDLRDMKVPRGKAAAAKHGEAIDALQKKGDAAMTKAERLSDRAKALRPVEARYGRLKGTAHDTVRDEHGRLTTKPRMEAERAAFARENAARAARAAMPVRAPAPVAAPPPAAAPSRAPTRTNGKIYRGGPYPTARAEFSLKGKQYEVSHILGVGGNVHITEKGRGGYVRTPNKRLKARAEKVLRAVIKHANAGGKRVQLVQPSAFGGLA